MTCPQLAVDLGSPLVSAPTWGMVRREGEGCPLVPPQGKESSISSWGEGRGLLSAMTSDRGQWHAWFLPALRGRRSKEPEMEGQEFVGQALS